MSFDYSIHLKDSIKKVAEKIKALDDTRFRIQVICRSQICVVHNVFSSSIVLYPLSSLYFKYDAQEKNFYHLLSSPSIDLESDDPELFTVIDQILNNEHVEIEFQEIQNPRYVETEYYVLRIK